MGCQCRKSRAGSTTASGGTILGYEVTYPDGTKHDGLFLTSLEAKKEIRRHGGGTARQITSGA